jgi:perosamine synthetase
MVEYKIPQVEPCIGREEWKNIKKVLKDRWFTEGQFAKQFIDKIQEMTGAKYVVLAPNGTLAIYMALRVCGIKRDDWVIVPDFTFNATASPLHFLGASPQFVDVEPDTLNISAEEVEKAIDKKRTKAIMPVHIFGESADMTSIMKIAEQNDLLVIEDAAQAYGVHHFWKGNNRHVGTIGDIGIISFYTDKSVCAGEGACIFTNDEKLYDKLRYLRNQGRLTSGSFIHEKLGMNFRMTDLQCAVGIAQLNKFPWILTRKHEIWNQYLIRLQNISDVEIAELKEVPFRFPLRIKNGKKEQVMRCLEEVGVQTRGFFYPLHKQPCWKFLQYEDDDFPNTIQAYEEGICLPIYPTLKEKQVDYICETIIEALA